MTWALRPTDVLSPNTAEGRARVGLNEHCFVRREHRCGKMFGASKSCFIACPTDPSVNPLVDLMSEKLTRHGIDPVVAVRERAYGQDILCTKICGRIIESRFCAVILDEGRQSDAMVPNPNVYYEYGLMTALGKHIIPLQRAEQKLAFNIQSHDTVKYDDGNMSAELERAIRDAIRLTEKPIPAELRRSLSDKAILRRFEVAGFKLDQSTFDQIIGDTVFLGFSGAATVFLARLDPEDDPGEFLEDLRVIALRAANEVKLRESRIQELTANPSTQKTGHDYQAYNGIYTIKSWGMDLATEKRMLEALEYIFVVFIAEHGHDDEFASSASEIVAGTRMQVVFSSSGVIHIGDRLVDLRGAGG